MPVVDETNTNDEADQAAKGTSLAKSYYDSDDAQKFYSAIWGEETVHIGRYDMLTDVDKQTLDLRQQISKAQEYHEQEFAKHIRSKFQDPVVMLDMGCGYGGLLRRLVQAGVVKTATGCDVSSQQNLDGSQGLKWQQSHISCLFRFPRRCANRLAA